MKDIWWKAERPYENKATCKVTPLLEKGKHVICNRKQALLIISDGKGWGIAPWLSGGTNCKNRRPEKAIELWHFPEYMLETKQY